jgi:predicted membrane-bound dolichyl-phosphate-mannose-protein mannosyltransferase
MSINKHILILIPLILSSFTHLWNPVQFPSFHIDEGVYIRRSLHTLNGLGPHDPDSKFDHPQSSTSAYDHPFFGQLFLAAIFKIIDFPQALKTTSDSVSIYKLFTTPRLIMGVIAVIDTLLIYKIGERRFNPTVALFSSLLFAVMPSSWFTRRVVLDSIMLPFILTSILLALETRVHAKRFNTILFLSGISLGLAIFTKISSFTMIPLIFFLIYQGSDIKAIRSKGIFKTAALFMLPVLMIPFIWPAYAFLSGDLNQWFDGVYWQATQRQSEDKTLFEIAKSFLKSDPVLLILGTVGVGYLVIRREFIGIIWTVPYFLLLYLIGWVNHFHLIIIIPIWCISIAKIIYDLPFIIRIKRKETLISSAITAGIVLFGIISTSMLISANLSYVQLKTASYISNAIVSNDSNLADNENKIRTSFDTNTSRDKITVISGPIYSWIFKYVFDDQYAFSHVRDTQPIKTEKIILVVDPIYKRAIAKTEAENQTQVSRLSNIYNNTDVAALFGKLPDSYSKKNYPFTGIDSADSGLTTTEIRKNY